MRFPRSPFVLPWSIESPSFAGRNIVGGCWNVLDVNIWAPSVISYWMAMWGLSLKRFLNLKSHQPFFLTSSLTPHLWEQAFHRCRVTNVPEVSNMLKTGQDLIRHEHPYQNLCSSFDHVWMPAIISTIAIIIVCVNECCCVPDIMIATLYAFSLFIMKLHKSIR